MINYDVKKIYEWPIPIQFIVIGLVAFIVLYLGYVVDISSLQNSIASGLVTEQALKQQLNDIYAKQITAANDMATLPKLSETLTQWQSKIITEAALPGLQDKILKLGQDNQLKFSSFNPAPPVQEGDYSKIPVTISTIGSFDQVGNFLSQIANMGYLVKIADFTLGEVPIRPHSNPNDVGPASAGNASGTSNAADTPSTTVNILNPDTSLKADLNLEIYRK